MPPSELHEVLEKLTREALPTGGRPHSDRVHISDRFGLREKAKQISDDLVNPRSSPFPRPLPPERTYALRRPDTR